MSFEFFPLYIRDYLFLSVFNFFLLSRTLTLISWIYLVWNLIDFLCLCLLSNLGRFQPLFLWVIFSTALLLYFFQDFADMNTIIPQVPTAPLAHSFLTHFFYVCSDWVISSVLSFMPLILSSVTSIFLLSLS